MIKNQEWVDNELSKNNEIIKFKYGKFEGSLTIKDQLHLKSINISDVKSIRKLTLSNLANLEECRIYQCDLEDLIIENCPNLNLLSINNNRLINLEFAKDLINLKTLEIEGNEVIYSGIKYLPDNLEVFLYEGTDLYKILESYQGDWKVYKQHLQEQSISEEESNRRELLSLKEEKVKIEIKYKKLKENVGEMLTSLKNKASSNDSITKELILDLERNVKEIVDENNKLKDELEQFKPLFNEKEPVIEAIKLGSGSFGAVYKGVWKTQFAAVKKSFANITDETELAEIKKELKILKNLRSNYTIQYYGEYQKDDGIYIIMEYAEHGSLAKFITDNKDREHDWQLNCNFIRQMVKGLRYLHSEKVLHRDLKSRNVLITEGYIAKLADFGLAKLLDSSYKSSSGEKLTGTIRWLAPEVLENSKHSYQSDIYSLGMVMWEIVSKDTLPFKDVDNNLVWFHIKNNGKEIISDNTPENIRNIIHQCWEDEPSERITLADILEIIGTDESDLQTNKSYEKSLDTRNLPESQISKKASEEFWGSKELDVNDIVNLQEEDPQEQSSIQAQIQIPPK